MRTQKGRVEVAKDRPARDGVTRDGVLHGGWLLCNEQ